MKSVPPTEDEILHWQTALQMIGIPGPKQTVPHTLGSWYEDCFNYKALMNESKDTIIVKRGQHWRTYKIEQAQNRRKEIRRFNLRDEMIDDISTFERRVRIRDIGKDILLIEELRSVIARP